MQVLAGVPSWRAQHQIDRLAGRSEAAAAKLISELVFAHLDVHVVRVRASLCAVLHCGAAPHATPLHALPG